MVPRLTSKVWRQVVWGQLRKHIYLECTGAMEGLKKGRTGLQVEFANVLRRSSLLVGPLGASERLCFSCFSFSLGLGIDTKRESKSTAILKAPQRCDRCEKQEVTHSW